MKIFIRRSAFNQDEEESSNGSPYSPTLRQSTIITGEVEAGINSYAVLMGYLSMAVRGLGFLVVTWTTVVLLGGFVSILGNKDFWSLTVITLSQTAGVFDVFLNEKMGNLIHVYRGLYMLHRVAAGWRKRRLRYEKQKDQDRRRRNTEESIRTGSNLWKAVVKGYLDSIVVIFWALVRISKRVVQALVLPVILLPLATLYMFGLYICTVVSLWRLIQHDYGDGGGANLKPALNVLYSLVVFQGLVFCYKHILARQEKSIVDVVSADLTYLNNSGVEKRAVTTAVWDYLHEAKIGCEKDPSFTTGKDLATYAVNLIESRSADSNRVGTMLLDVLLCRKDADEHKLIINQIIGWGTCSHHLVLEKLLGTLDPGNPHDIEEKQRAASTVAHLASVVKIRLVQFPAWADAIFSMLDDTYLVDDGLSILYHLSHSKYNRRVMSNTQGLVSSIMVQLGGPHGDHSGTWERIASLIRQLVLDAPGETGVKLRSEMSKCQKAICTLDSILRCGECDPLDRIKANDILVDLSLDHMTSRPEESSPILSFSARKEENLINILVDSFVNYENIYSKIYVSGQKLAMLSLQRKSSANLILKANDDDVAASLITVMQCKADEKEQEYRERAAEILENLCSHYTKDDECFQGLKKTLIDALQKLLREIIPWLTREEIREGTEAHTNIAFSAPSAVIEKGSSSQADQNARKGEQEDEDRKLTEDLKFFCLIATVCEKLFGADQDLSCEFDNITAAICSDLEKPVRTLDSLINETKEALEAREAQSEQEEAGEMNWELCAP